MTNATEHNRLTIRDMPAHVMEKHTQFSFGKGTQFWETDDQRYIQVSRPCAIPKTEEFLAKWKASKKRKGRFLSRPEEDFSPDTTTSTYVLIGKNSAAREYRSLSRAVLDPKFPLPYRITAGINLAEAVYWLEEQFGSLRFAIHPDSFLLNITTGDVYCFPDCWLEGLSTSHSGYECYDPPEWYDGGGAEVLSASQAVQHFLAVAEFRLLCADDPFDYPGTLAEYPCITRETKKKIYGTDSRFLFSGPESAPNQFAGVRAMTQWERYPSYLKELFRRSLSDGARDPAQRASTEEWLYELRRLRDCLVPKDREYRFVDPDTFCFTASNEPYHGLVMEIKSDEESYIVPMCPQKAVYWYHANLSPDFAEAGDRGMIGAVQLSPNGATLILQNRCKHAWFRLNNFDKKEEIAYQKSIVLKKDTKLLLPSVSEDGSVTGTVKLL